MSEAEEPRRILFVCQHGAFRSRMAAAYFNAAAPAGWTAESAGITPQTAVSERLRPVLARTVAEPFIDDGPPVPAADVQAERTIAIDADVSGADAWRTGDGEPRTDEEIRDEISDRVRRLVAELT